MQLPALGAAHGDAQRLHVQAATSLLFMQAQMTQATLIAMLHERGLEVRVPQQDVAAVWERWRFPLFAWESSLLYALRLLHVLLLRSYRGKSVEADCDSHQNRFLHLAGKAFPIESAAACITWYCN